MLEDSQRDNTDLNACACEEKSVLIMNKTPDHNVNAVELVLAMMLNSELEVTDRSIDSILNVSQARHRQTRLTSESQGV